MEPAQFEEKDFEAPLYNQLLRGDNRLATPGQVFEGHFGIDAAMQAPHSAFWQMFGYPSAPPGCCLNDFRWGFVWRRLGHKRVLPNFSTNLLIQSKRPHVLTRARGPLHTLGLSAPVWRYAITPHQQPLLEAIAHTLGHRALVIYASTAFDTLNDLYRYTDAGTMVEHCNYTRVQRLTNHTKWNYDSPGTRGVGTSEPELIEDRPFEALLDEVNGAQKPQAVAEKELYLLASGIEGACERLSRSMPLAHRIAELMHSVDQNQPEPGRDMSPQSSFGKILVALHSLKVQWFVGGDGGEQDKSSVRAGARR